MTIALFPHQLFTEALQEGSVIILVEHPLFFSQLPFHRQKLIFHHATLRAFRDEAVARDCGCTLVLLEEVSNTSLKEYLVNQGHTQVTFYEPRDDYLSQEIRDIAKDVNVTIQKSPSFLTSLDEWIPLQEKQATLRMNTFYQWQRKRLNILMDGTVPTGGKWSFDTENRKKLPKTMGAPPAFRPNYSPKDEFYIQEAAVRFSQSPGSDAFSYPITHSQALEALRFFIDHKLSQFGDYEDAVSQHDPVLFHSQLSPLLNCGLLTPHHVVSEVLEFADNNPVPINSLEGFIRQIIGWREFMSLTYLTHGRAMRTSNVLHHSNELPACFWEGKTGILPIDHTVRQVLTTGYAHHIERLMILGVFMLLTETKPTEAYRWFFAMFIDAYDWVMVPNVYGMSQYAAGGLLTTKPYLCGSAYLRKMTDFPTGEWCTIWDGLYWRFVSRNQELLQRNPRTAMSVASWKKFTPQKQADHITAAEQFLKRYYG